jgi:four helix bundle protein
MRGRGACTVPATWIRPQKTLTARTRHFAVAILDFVETLPRAPFGDAVARRLARAGLGIAGNYRGGCRGRSHTEFTAKLGGVLEEADEAVLWLEVCDARAMGDAKRRPCCSTKAATCARIFSKACMTVRANEKKG